VLRGASPHVQGLKYAGFVCRATHASGSRVCADPAIGSAAGDARSGTA